MKEIKAYIRSNMTDTVVDALETMSGVSSFAVVPVNEFGHDTATGELARVSMVKIEVDVPDDEVESIVDCILAHARTGEGHAGDGKVLVSELSEAIRIENGVSGDSALRRRNRGPD